MSKWNKPVDPITLLNRMVGRVDALERVSAFDNTFAPAAPTNVTFASTIREKKTVAEYRGIVSCDASTPDTCQADIDYYVFQLKPVDSSGADIDGTNIRTHIINRHDATSMTTPHAIWHQLDHPNTYYWVSRAWVIDRAGRIGAKSAWTTRVKATTVSNAQPPAPAGVTISFDRVKKDRYNRYRAVVQFNLVTGWSIPGGDDAASISHYIVQLRQTDSGGTFIDANPDKVTVHHNEDGNGSTGRAPFFPVRKGSYYKAQVFTVDVYGRRSASSGFTAVASVSDTTPPANPTSVVAEGLYNEVGIDWDVAVDGAGTPDEDTVYYQVVCATNSSLSNVVNYDRYVLNTRRTFRTKNYSQRYWLGVRAVDAAGNKTAYQTVGPVKPQKVTGSRTVSSAVGIPSEIDYTNESGVPLVGSKTNRLYLSSSTANAVITADGEVTGDVLIEAVIKTSDTINLTHVGVIFKGSNSNNFLLLDLQAVGVGGTGVNLLIKKRVSGTFTTLYGPATGGSYGDELYFGIKYIASTGAIFIDPDHSGFPGAANYTLTAGEKTTFGTNTLVGLYTDFGATTGTNDDGHSRIDNITVTDLATGLTTLIDKFDRAPSSSVVGISDSGHTWTSNVGTWGISSDAIPGSILGYGSIIPMFYAEDTTERLRTFTSGVTTSMGEAGINTVAMSILITQPTRFMCWASANVMLNESTGNSINMKFQIAIDPGTGTKSLGVSGIQTTNLNDYSNNNKRYIANQRDYFYDASLAAPAQLDFYWVWSHNAASNKSLALNNQKLSVIASYAPDYAPPGIVNPGSSWASKSLNITRYKRSETNA